MFVPRFHHPSPLLPADVGREVELPEAAAHHAARVLRMATGDPVVLFTGDGGEFHATLARVDRRGAMVRVDRHDPVERESPLDVTVAQAVLAADAMDGAVRRMVELGVRAVEPVIATRTNAPLAGERGEKRLAHWRQIAISACEQCGRNRVPPIAPVQRLAAWLDARADSSGDKSAILLPGAGLSLAALAGRAAPRYLIVGPEGGFTAEEAAHAAERGAMAVHLGSRVLRADTAGPAALATLNALCGDAR